MKAFLKKNNLHGVVIIEFIIFFPVFLLFLFFLIWVGNYIHAKNSLYSAVSNGVMLAKTRGNFSTMNFNFDERGKGSLSYIDSYIDSGVWSPRLSFLLGSKQSKNKGLIVKDEYESFLKNTKCSTRKNSYGKSYKACFYPNATLRDIPREALYAMVFVANELKLSFGNSMTLPCNPGNEENVIGGLEDELSCISCNLMPLSEMGLTSCRDDSCESVINEKGIARDRFGIECFYRLPSSFISRIFTILGFKEMGLGVLISAKQWVFRNISEFCLKNPELSECELR